METKFHNPKTLFSAPGFSHAVSVKDARTWIYVSGQVSADKDGKIVAPGDIENQIRQTMKNIRLALKDAGADFKDVVKVNIYVTDIRFIEPVRKVRAEFLDQKNPPAITSVAIAGLARHGALIEIEVIAAQ
ncbi:MAG: RidA family protein [Thaumarchaeota archaeon]|nr:RidA family protein [Nitrososphaerota archaeon]